MFRNRFGKAALAAIAAHGGLVVAHAQAPREAIETMIVTDRASDADAALTPGATTIIDTRALRGGSVASLADLLRYTPGIWAVSDSGSDDIFISSRGSNLDATDYDMNGVKLLQDGLPVTTADGNNHNRVIDPLSARFVTVARGANALQYGASTLGGAIDFVSPTARGSSSHEVSVNAGSHGQRLLRATLARVLSADTDALVTLEGKHWDGYRRHNEQRRSGLYANVGWRPGPGVESRFFVTYLDNRQRLPGSLSRDAAAADPWQANVGAERGDYQLDVSTLRFANKTRLELGCGRSLEIGLSRETQELFHPIVDKIMADLDGPGPAPPVEVFSLLVATDHREIGAVARYRQRIGPHDLLVGLGYGRSDVDGGNFRNDGGRPNGLSTIIDNDAVSVELYATDRWRLGSRWLVELAAQGVLAERRVRNIDAATHALRAPRGDYSRVSPRAGVIYDAAEDIQVYANASSLFEPPTNYELEDDVAGGGTALAAMRGTAFELGVRGRRGLGRASEWTWDMALYRARIEDEILATEDPAAPGTSLTSNVPRTIHSGLEAAVGAVLELRGMAAIEPTMSVTVNDFSFDGDATYGNNRLPAAPRYAVRAEVLYRHSSGFYAGPTLDVVSGRYADFANTYRVDSHTLVGLRAGWTGMRWRAFVEARNLRDDRYTATHGVRTRAAGGAPLLNIGEPRSVYLGVQTAF
jgi:iron complex outermembrane receptor protein